MATLHIARKNGASEEFPFENKTEVTVGRASDNDIKVTDGAASGHHCVILRDGNKYTVKDLEATNTTRLNNVRVSESRLNPQDVIMVGSIGIMIDGEDIEIDKTTASSGTQSIEIGNTKKMAVPTGSASPFSARKSRKGLWITLIVVGVIIIIGAVGFFIIQLSQKAG